MRCLDKNKQAFYYASYEGTKPVVDEYGNETGETVIVRGKPQKEWANISEAVGKVEHLIFGTVEDYDRVIAIDMEYKDLINEQTIFWIDVELSLDEEGNLKLDEYGEVLTPHNYEVERIARSLNSLLIAVKRVKTSYE